MVLDASSHGLIRLFKIFSTLYFASLATSLQRRVVPSLKRRFCLFDIEAISSLAHISTRRDSPSVNRSPCPTHYESFVDANQFTHFFSVSSS